MEYEREMSDIEVERTWLGWVAGKLLAFFCRKVYSYTLDPERQPKAICNSTSGTLTYSPKGFFFFQKNKKVFLGVVFVV